MKDNKLKPCPFCGGNATIRKDVRYVDFVMKTVYGVICIECGFQIPFMFPKKESIEIWNRRADIITLNKKRTGITRTTPPYW